YQQEVDLISLFKDVASDYVQMAVEPWQLKHLIDQAVRLAKANRSVTCIIIPNDLQRKEMTTSYPRIHGSTNSGVGYSYPRVIPREEDLVKAAEILNSGKRVAILAGAGALG